MNTFNNQAAQGDLLITRISQLPADAQALQKTGMQIVAHSETGHHHVMSTESATFYQAANDEFVLYVVVDNDTTLLHERGFDTHAPISVGPGIYRINRQREYTPEGFRRAQD